MKKITVLALLLACSAASWAGDKNSAWNKYLHGYEYQARVAYNLGALMSLATVFLFKNRKLQINLCSINLLFNVLWYVDYAVIFFGLVGLEKVSGNLTFHWGAVMPLLSLVFVLLARKGVSDDEKLVRAADRIR